MAVSVLQWTAGRKDLLLGPAFLLSSMSLVWLVIAPASPTLQRAEAVDNASKVLEDRRLTAPVEGEGGDLPLAVLENAEFDFGVITPRDSISHAFVLKNGGTGNLEVKRLISSCGCTTAELSSDSVSPRSSVDIEVTLDLRGRFGHQERSVAVLTNDPANPMLRLVVKGTVRPERRLAGHGTSLSQPTSDTEAVAPGFAGR